MERIPEPELMDGIEQALAYAEADFAAAHEQIVNQFARVFPQGHAPGPVADLGCGPADFTVRFAHRHPECVIEGMDGAPQMLSLGRARLEQERLVERVRLMECVLPDPRLPAHHYGTVLSNSLLHHLHDPRVLWDTIRSIGRSGACVFVADLMRSPSGQEAQALVDRYAGAEAPILRRDFLHSLFAAFTPEEVTQQLSAAGLEGLTVEVISDRHLIVHGRLP